MDFDSLINAGKELLNQNGGGSMGDAVQSLLSNSDGKLDLDSLVSGIQDEKLAGVVSSWLGDGDNVMPSTENITALLGNEKIASVAGKFGIDSTTLVSSLQNVLPGIIDKSSQGGSLLDTNQLMSVASKFFRS